MQHVIFYSISKILIFNELLMFSPDDVQLLPHVKDDQKYKVPIKHVEEF